MISSCLQQPGIKNEIQADHKALPKEVIDETYIDGQDVFIWLGATGWRSMKVDEKARSTVGAEFVCL